MKGASEAVKTVATNRKAAHDYFLEDRLEAGLVLQGSEIKSIRAGQVSLKEAYVRTDGRQAWLVNAHISPYDPASRENHDPLRERKLLLHRREIDRLGGRASDRGLTLVPLRAYLKNGRVKMEIGLARGKHAHDKREAIKRKDQEREARQALRRRD